MLTKRRKQQCNQRCKFSNVGKITSNRSTRDGMEARAEHQRTVHYLSYYSATVATGIGLILMSFVWALKYRGGFGWQSGDVAVQFNWHPVLMIISMVFLFGQSILIYRTGRYLPKRYLKLTHTTIHGVAFILTVIALKVVFDSHNYAKPPIPNLYTMHSWLGLSAVILFALQFVIGFVTFLYPGLTTTLRQAVLPMHVASGTAIFVLALTAVVTGLTEKTIWALGADYGKLPAEGVLVNTMCAFAVFYVLLTMYLVQEWDFKRIETVDDHIGLTAQPGPRFNGDNN